MLQHSLEIRVAYQETDGQRRVHHANYLNYFERGRVEMLRSFGHDYKGIEDRGMMFVVTEMNVRYFAPADFDDVLTITTEVVELRKVRMRHRYTIRRGDTVLVEADSVIACVDRNGKPARLPDLTPVHQPDKELAS
ncbi:MULTISPECIES: acyl-CoA thioesterase [Pirellulaceae]|uniref:Acyl-CoA thioester hydrolase n=1 Tax=Aporhodopirellula rubra TaxID=980271 RepID=A0A7W5H5P0_9BACT|nr:MULTISPECIES: thioesterase family protein [Pirellulaceae]EMI41929.1 4-hydroxybenzoyl-CoA thioesterase [Rhodopirellula sp. SWK7]MBB3207712.1 acyl-CoA thioester hydrolase [Aporhodopirellula rubra]